MIDYKVVILWGRIHRAGHDGAADGAQSREGGFPLTVATRSFAKAESLAKELPGVRAVSDPAEVGKHSDVVVSSVPDAPQVEEVHLGPKGTAAGAARGTVAIDTSTIAAESARIVAQRLSERGIALLDAPVSGGQKGAIEGTLTFFVGGDAAALEKARPVFEALGKRITDCVGRRAEAGSGEPDPRLKSTSCGPRALRSQKAGLRCRLCVITGEAASPAAEVPGKKMTTATSPASRSSISKGPRDRAQTTGAILCRALPSLPATRRPGSRGAAATTVRRPSPPHSTRSSEISEPAAAVSEPAASRHLNRARGNQIPQNQGPKVRLKKTRHPSGKWSPRS